MKESVGGVEIVEGGKCDSTGAFDGTDACGGETVSSLSVVALSISALLARARHEEISCWICQFWML